MADIQIDISPSGETVVEVTNVVGASCKTLTGSLEKALGKSTKVENKPEFHQQVTHQNQQQQGLK